MRGWADGAWVSVVRTGSRWWREGSKDVPQHGGRRDHRPPCLAGPHGTPYRGVGGRPKAATWWPPGGERGGGAWGMSTVGGGGDARPTLEEEEERRRRRRKEAGRRSKERGDTESRRLSGCLVPFWVVRWTSIENYDTSTNRGAPRWTSVGHSGTTTIALDFRHQGRPGGSGRSSRASQR